MNTRILPSAQISLIALLLSLAGCAPGVRGTSLSSPFDVDFADATSIMEVVAGNRYFVTNSSFYAYPEDFGYTRQEANDLLDADLQRVGQSVRKNVAREFTLREVRAPDNWDVDLFRVEATRVVTDRDLDNRIVYIQDNIQFMFSVHIPEGASSGTNFVIITVEGKDRTTSVITLRFRVLEPQQEMSAV